MPPLAVEGLESVAEHRLAQDHAVGELLSRDASACGTLAVITRIFARFGIAAEVGMALRTEPVEGAAHIEFLFRGHVEEGEIDGGTACVAASHRCTPVGRARSCRGRDRSRPSSACRGCLPPSAQSGLHPSADGRRHRSSTDSLAPSRRR